MCRNGLQRKRRVIIIILVTMIFFSVLMTSVEIPSSSLPHHKRSVDQFADYSKVDSAYSLSQQEHLKQNAPKASTAPSEESTTVSSAESGKQTELRTTAQQQLPHNETEQITTTTSTSSPKIIKVKDVYPSKPSFSYPNPKLCLRDGMGVKLLIIVTSAPSHFLHREAIRLTWGHFTLRRDLNIAFLIGKTDDRNTTDGLLEEMSLYSDIIQANFQDTYRNLTLKTFAALEWTIRYCSKAEYLLKTDDDMFINVHNLLQFIHKVDKDDREEPKIYGRLVQEAWADRSEDSKYFLPYDQFTNNEFPDYVAGGAYLFSTLIAQSLFEKGMEAQFMQMEDVFLTGVVAESMNVTRVGVDEFRTDRFEMVNTSRCELSKFISFHMISYPEQFEIWGKVSDGKTEC
jgi:uncharacterized protein YxeA